MILHYFIEGNEVFENDISGISDKTFYQLYLTSQKEKFTEETRLLKIKKEGKKCFLVESDVAFKDVI